MKTVDLPLFSGAVATKQVVTVVVGECVGVSDLASDPENPTSMLYMRPTGMVFTLAVSREKAVSLIWGNE